MRIADRFHSAVMTSMAQLPGPERLPEAVASACAEVLPVQGACISLVYANRRLPLGASDSVSAQAERLEFTVGEGPSSSAAVSGLPLVADSTTLAINWPPYYDALISQTWVRGVVSLPLRGGLGGLGVLDLYTASSMDVLTVSLTESLTVVREVGTVFDVASDRRMRRVDGPLWLDAPAAGRRASVWQAVGMLQSALGLATSDALALIRAHAYSSEQDIDEMASLMVSRDVPLDDLAFDAFND